jgi:hypothetical protein
MAKATRTCAAGMLLILSEMKQYMKGKKSDNDQQRASVAPPAPMRGPNRESLLKLLSRPDAESRLPITLAKYRPDAVVRKEKNLWIIRKLVEDREAVQKAYEKAASDKENFMDEHTWQFLQPGPILVEAGTKIEFIKKIEAMPWDYGE